MRNSELGIRNYLHSCCLIFKNENGTNTNDNRVRTVFLYLRNKIIPHSEFLIPNLLDSSRFCVETLILRMTHGECLSRECAVLDNGREKLFLAHIGEEETYSVISLCKLADNVLAVDIIDLAAVFLDISIEELLEAANGEV